MPRLFTRAKRKLRMTTSKHSKSRKRTKKKGAKTFKTAEKAKEYAQKVLKLAEDKFKIVPAKRNKKFKVVKN
jgi:hypothetical protein